MGSQGAISARGVTLLNWQMPQQAFNRVDAFNCYFERSVLVHCESILPKIN
jgi:hypothetical protein